MIGTPIFDEVHRDLAAPTMRFAEPDGSIIFYGIPFYPSFDAQTVALSIAPSPSLLNIPVVNDGC